MLTTVVLWVAGATRCAVTLNGTLSREVEIVFKGVLARPHYGAILKMSSEHTALSDWHRYGLNAGCLPNYSARFWL
jgi:hypothetical protein